MIGCLASQAGGGRPEGARARAESSARRVGSLRRKAGRCACLLPGAARLRPNKMMLAKPINRRLSLAPICARARRAAHPLIWL